MATFRLRWRFFWSRRSRLRTSLALLLLFVALLAITYITLPSSGQTRVQDGLLVAGRSIHSLGLRNALLGAVALCLIVSVLLIFLPTYRRHSYLATSRSIIPPVSVYLDAENQLSEVAIRPFTDFLIKHLDGRRADLLYFLDASKTAGGDKYKTLYRHGFRPVDVPHDPTGKGRVKEAVDRELAMHAFERAVLGPPDQEFIIVTGDGDFVHLVYRLVAQGHKVQVWAAPVRDAYRVLETYLGVTVNDLSRIISELNVAPSEAVDNAPPPPPSGRRNRRRRRRYGPRRENTLVAARIVGPTTLADRHAESIYFGLAETLVAHADVLARFHGDTGRNSNFYSLLRGTYGPRLASIGYSAGNWIEYWLEHLVALDVLQRVAGQSFPKRGPTHTEDAALSLLAMAQLSARVAIEVGESHPEGLVRMSEVANSMTEQIPAAAGAGPLLGLVALSNAKRITHTRYFVRSARALGLVDFEDVSDSLDVIRYPRLPVRIQTDHSDNNADVALDSTAEAADGESTV